MVGTPLGRADADLDRELRTHLALEEDEQIDAGLAPRDARDAARRALGSMTLVKEDTRAAWGWIAVEQCARDLRYGLRGLWRTKWISAAAVITLALGIGANTALFSVVDAVLLRALPFREPDQLVVVTQDSSAIGQNVNQFAPTTFFDWKRHSESLGDLAALHNIRVNLVVRGEPMQVAAQEVTAGLFDLLGVQPCRTRHVPARICRAARVVLVSQAVAGARGDHDCRANRDARWPALDHHRRPARPWRPWAAAHQPVGADRAQSTDAGPKDVTYDPAPLPGRHRRSGGRGWAHCHRFSQDAPRRSSARTTPSARWRARLLAGALRRAAGAAGGGCVLLVACTNVAGAADARRVNASAVRVAWRHARPADRAAAGETSARHLGAAWPLVAGWRPRLCARAARPRHSRIDQIRRTPSSSSRSASSSPPACPGVFLAWRRRARR